MSKLLVAGAREGGHLTVQLKHEIPHIELLSRVFACCEGGEVSAWGADEPTGQRFASACSARRRRKDRARSCAN